MTALAWARLLAEAWKLEAMAMSECVMQQAKRLRHTLEYNDAR
jgi:hypothetical protein